MLRGLALEPDLGRAAAFDDEEDLLVHVLLGIEGAARRHLDHVAAPLALGAIELDVAAAPARALPRHQREVLDLADPDVAEHRNAFRFHEGVVRGRELLELAESGPIVAGRFVPVGLVRNFMRHDGLQMRVMRAKAGPSGFEPLRAPS